MKRGGYVVLWLFWPKRKPFRIDNHISSILVEIYVFHSERVLNVLCYKRILHSFRYSYYVYTVYNWLIILFYCHTYTLPFRRSYTISVQSFWNIIKTNKCSPSTHSDRKNERDMIVINLYEIDRLFFFLFFASYLLESTHRKHLNKFFILLND